MKLEYEKLLANGHFYALETGKSEDLAAFAHFLLTVTPFGQSKRDWQKDLNTNQTAKDTKELSKEPEKDKSPKSSQKIPKVDDDKKSTSGKSDKDKEKEKQSTSGKNEKPKNK